MKGVLFTSFCVILSEVNRSDSGDLRSEESRSMTAILRFALLRPATLRMTIGET
jgi:hypothetical protein